MAQAVPCISGIFPFLIKQLLGNKDPSTTIRVLRLTTSSNYFQFSSGSVTKIGSLYLAASTWCVPVPLRTVLLCVSFRKHVHYYRPCQGAGALRCPKTRRTCTLGSKTVYTDSGRGPLLALFPGPAGLLPGPAGPGPAGLDRSEWAERAPSSTKGSAPPFSILHPRSCIYRALQTTGSAQNHRALPPYRYLCLHCVIKRQHRLEETIYYIYKNRGCRPGLCIRIFRRRSLPDDRAAMRTTPLPPLLLHVTERASGT